MTSNDRVTATTPEPRSIAVLTSGRQDWGIVHSPSAAIRDHPDLSLRLWVGGTHLSKRHGWTLAQVRDDGFEPDSMFSWLDGPDDPTADVQAAAALTSLGAQFRRTPVDVILLAGDRFETAAAALAATLERVPIVHLHGGEQTLGAFDDALRHAITKLSHLHLVSNDEHARRVVALGEDPRSVHVVGAPGLDAAFRADLPDRAALEESLGMTLARPVIVVTVHPATLEVDPAGAARAVAAAMDAVPGTYVVTLPNTDPGAARVRAIMVEAAGRPGRIALEALGESRYWGLLRIADAVLGNSSSGISEAPALGLPAVDVGDRQAGRHRSVNVLHAVETPDAVVAALRQALTPGFRAIAATCDVPLADGQAGRRVADIIAAWHPVKPLRKPPIQVEG